MEWQTTYKEWLDYDNLSPMVRENLVSLVDNQTELEDAFYAPLEFGTAGMRGKLGAGINRMNIYTVRQAAEGLARFIENQGEEAKKRGVAIAYDSRHQSSEFAMESGRVLAAHGIKSYIFEDLRPTPELSFTVRELHCIAGIMITASHNPAEYNGFKVYGADGGQMPPHDADEVIKYVRSIENPLNIKTLPITESKDFIKMIGEDIDDLYLDQLKTVTINNEMIKRSGKQLNMVFTPLHGTGKMLGEKALLEAGFTNVALVEEQAIADPNFSTVDSPNPEEKNAFEYAISLGKQNGADVLVATDPDADRLAAAVRMPNGDYEVLSGNQLASVMIHYILSQKADNEELPKNAVVLKSIVSSELPTAICQKYKVKMESVLTGFKFIAEKIKQYEETKEYTFMFGFEESYGYLIKPFVRDKDAIQTLVLLAEIATYYREKEQTLYDGLQAIYTEFGFFEEKTISLTKQGVEGLKEIQDIINSIRQELPNMFGELAVSYVEDYLTQTRHKQDGTTEILTLPSANVLKFFLEDGSWIAVRPSGTEPKIKFYMGIVGKSKDVTEKKLSMLESSLAAYIE